MGRTILSPSRQKNIKNTNLGHMILLKASAGLIREIIQNGSVEDAMKNAESLAEKYSQEGKNICNSIGKMNPYTNVNILVEQLLAVIS